MSGLEARSLRPLGFGVVVVVVEAGCWLEGSGQGTAMMKSNASLGACTPSWVPLPMRVGRMYRKRPG